MQKRRLGRTGHESTVVTFGTVGIGRTGMTQEVVNHIDIAPGYGEAMERLAPWMPRLRDGVFLGSKTTERTKDSAWESIRSAMSRLWHNAHGNAKAGQGV